MYFVFHEFCAPLDRFTETLQINCSILWRSLQLQSRVHYDKTSTYYNDIILANTEYLNETNRYRCQRQLYVLSVIYAKHLRNRNVATADIYEQ